MMLRFAGVALLLAGCVRKDITILPMDVEKARDELNATPAQTITVLDNDGSPVTVKATDVVDLVDTLGVHHAITIRELVEPCSSERGPCKDGIDRVVIDHVHVLSDGGTSALIVTGVIAGIAGAVYCAAECSSPTNYIVPVGALVLGLGTLGVLYLYGQGMAALHN